MGKRLASKGHETPHLPAKGTRHRQRSDNGCRASELAEKDYENGAGIGGKHHKRRAAKLVSVSSFWYRSA